MGVRFRKSINLGKGFRINMSKSGPGFSWGGKGFRVTKKANGGFRTTAYIPGTGLSYQKDFSNPLKGGKSPSNRSHKPKRSNRKNPIKYRRSPSKEGRSLYNKFDWW